MEVLPRYTVSQGLCQDCECRSDPSGRLRVTVIGVLRGQGVMPRTELLARSVLVSSGALCDCHSRLILKVGGGHISLTDGRENLVGTPCRVVNWLLSCLVCFPPNSLHYLVCGWKRSRWGEGHSCISVLPLSEEVPFRVAGPHRGSVIAYREEERNGWPWNRHLW